MRHLSTIALIALLLGFGQFALANKASFPERKSSSCPHCINSTSLTKMACAEQGEAAEDTVGDREGLSLQAKENSAASMPAGEVKETKKISQPEKESSSHTFSFLYYLFYKFSISDFFQTPSLL